VEPIWIRAGLSHEFNEDILMLWSRIERYPGYQVSVEAAMRTISTRGVPCDSVHLKIRRHDTTVEVHIEEDGGGDVFMTVSTQGKTRMADLMGANLVWLDNDEPVVDLMMEALHYWIE